MKEKKKGRARRVFMALLAALGACVGITRELDRRKNCKERMESDY
jgi:hypothetical protein